MRFDFVDLSIDGSSAAPARPSREDGPAGFGDALHGALSQNEPKDAAGVDRRPSHRHADERTRDVEKDADRNDPSNADVITVVGAVDQMRPMPEPIPPAGNGSSEPSLDPEHSAEVLKAILLAMLHGDAARPASSAGPPAQGRLDAQNLTETTGELANNVIAMMQRLAGGDQTDGAPTDAADTGGDQWRHVLMAKLSGLVETSFVQRSNTPAGVNIATSASPIHQDMTRILSALANDHDPSEPRSLAHALNASRLIEMLDLDKPSNLDRHVQSFLNHLRLDLSPETSPAVEIAAAGAIAAPVDVDAFEADLQEQIVQSIRVRALDLGGEVRVRLRPAYLGEVVVAVKVDAGAVTATLQADKAAVRRWMETNEASLRIGLADHGLHLDRLIVSEPSKSESEPEERRRRPQHEQPARQEPRRSTRREAEPGTFEVVI